MENDAQAVLGGSDPDNCSYKDGMNFNQLKSVCTKNWARLEKKTASKFFGTNNSFTVINFFQLLLKRQANPQVKIKSYSVSMKWDSIRVSYISS